MARPMTMAAATALAEGDVRPALLFEGLFSDGTLRLTTGPLSVEWGGVTYTANGVMTGFSSPQEGTNAEAAGWTLTLTGIPSDLVSTALGQARRGKIGRVWLAFLDLWGGIITDPFFIAQGRLDVPVISDDGATSTISIAYEGHLRDIVRPQELRYTNEEQQRLFPGDRGFEYVTSIIDRQIQWGRT